MFPPLECNDTSATTSLIHDTTTLVTSGTITSVKTKWLWRQRKALEFQSRLESLRKFKDEHGHLHVREKILAKFCNNARHARRHPGAAKCMKMTAERIASLDALGFDWEPQRRCGPGRPPGSKNKATLQRERKAAAAQKRTRTMKMACAPEPPSKESVSASKKRKASATRGRLASPHSALRPGSAAVK